MMNLLAKSSTYNKIFYTTLQFSSLLIKNLTTFLFKSFYCITYSFYNKIIFFFEKHQVLYLKDI